MASGRMRHFGASLGSKRTLNSHMENIDILISEEAQQDMDLKSAFAPAVPRQAFFRILLGDPKQSPGGVADGQRAHRTLLLKAPIGLRTCLVHAA